MTVEFALFLSPEGIALAHRQAEGHWALIGDTSLDVPDLGAALTELSAKGAERGGPGFPTLLILPDDQILYKNLEGLGGTTDIPAQLDGLTPYDLSEIAYDYRDLGGGRAHVAVVARETLSEAEAFATAHGFFGVGFAASPPVERFAGVPLFQRSAEAAGLTFPESGLEFGPDTWAPVEEAPEPSVPEEEPAPEPEPVAEGDAEEALSAEAEVEAEETDTPGTLKAVEPNAESAEEPVEESEADDAPAPVQPRSAHAETVEAAPEETDAPPAEDDADAEAEASTPEPVTKSAKPRKPTEPDEPLHMPAGFGARRGKVAAPEAAAGRLVSERQARFGLGAKQSESPAEDLSAPAPEAPIPAPTGDATLPDRETGLSAPPRARAELASSAPGRRLTPDREFAAQMSAPEVSDSSAEASTGARIQGAAKGLAERLARRAPKDEPAAAETPPAVAPSDEPVMGGLLSRRAPTGTGPSLRTGLVLTLILLLILALIAVWSALFLPDSTVARLLGREAPTIETTNAPPVVSAPTAPDRDAEVARLPEPVETPIIEAPAPEAETASLQPEALPDIDAELDLGPAPVDPEALLPSVEETEALYASSGIWQRTPEPPTAIDTSEGDVINLAAIDQVVVAHDALALPAPDIGTLTTPPRRYVSPAPFGTIYLLGPDGQIQPTPEGVLTPDGVFLRAGQPPVAAVRRPRTEENAVEEALPSDETDAAPVLDVDAALLSAFQPTPRPTDLIERRERQVLGGFTLAELSSRRPTIRPPSVQQLALAAREAQEATTPEPQTGTPGATFDAEVLTGEAQVIQASALAVASSRMPASRPGDFDEIVARATRGTTERSGSGASTAAVQQASAPARVEPSIPSNATVSRAATESNAINLRRVNLIGVSGTPSDRRALVRLPSGRFVRVGVGDRVDGGRVAAIGENTLQYVKNGQNITLEVPG